MKKPVKIRVFMTRRQWSADMTVSEYAQEMKHKSQGHTRRMLYYILERFGDQNHS